MTPGLKWLLIAWGIVTGILIILLIDRSTLTMKEDDQLFLDESSSSNGCRTERTDPPRRRGLGGLHWVELGTAITANYASVM
jgi:hypothetical protein